MSHREGSALSIVCWERSRARSFEMDGAASLVNAQYQSVRSRVVRIVPKKAGTLFNSSGNNEVIISTHDRAFGIILLQCSSDLRRKARTGIMKLMIDKGVLH